MKSSRPKDEKLYKEVGNYILTSQLLGKGAFGSVFKGHTKNNKNEFFAIKEISIEKMSSNSKFFKLLDREMNILKEIKDKNIVNLIDSKRTTRNQYLILEFCDEGDLHQKIKKNGTIPESKCLKYLKDIIAGFKVLYQNNIIHRDLKPSNILINNDVAKLADFGMARVIECGMEELNYFTIVGTPYYMSPQMLAKEKFSSKCDIWALGIVVYEMLFGFIPWKGENSENFLKNIKEQQLFFPEKPKRNEKILKLIRSMLEIDEESRISWPNLFEHELITNSKIYEELKAIEIVSPNDFQKSFLKNELYLKLNGVMTLSNKENEISQKFFEVIYYKYKIEKK